MIDDQHVRVPGPPPRLVIKAVFVGGALLSEAVPAIAGHFVPHVGERAEAEIAAGAVVGVFRPLEDRLELLEFLLLEKGRLRPVDRGRHPPQADVVRPPLGQHERKLDRHHRLQERNVPREELLLQTDRVRRDDQRFFRLVLQFLFADHGQNGRNQIGETLADAGPRLDDQVRLLRDGPLDRGRHLELLRPVFIGPQPLGDPSFLAEHGCRVKGQNFPPKKCKKRERRLVRAVIVPARRNDD